MATDNFEPIQLGGKYIDLDDLHVAVDGGTIMLSAGTLDVGDVNVDLLRAGTVTALANGTITAGTVNLVSAVSNLAAGTISAVSNIVTGTLATLGTVDRCNPAKLYHAKAQNMYTASNYAALGSGGTMLVTLASPGTIMHFWPSISSKGAIKVRILEGGTTTPAGTLTNYNRYRTSANVSSAQWITGEESAGGTAIYQEYEGAGSGPKVAGGDVTEEIGWFGATGIETAIEVVDLSSAENNVSVVVDWHEHV